MSGHPPLHSAQFPPTNAPLTSIAAIVIPARYGSTRFPGKPLLRETGKFLIQHVVEQAAKAKRASRVVVATDDPRIADAVASFGGVAVMTSPTHQSGTDRIAEVMQRPEFAAVNVVVNVQGDEPEIDPALIDTLIAVLSPPTPPAAGLSPQSSVLSTPSSCPSMATVAAPFTSTEDIANPNMVKVVLDRDGFALYFSRAPIPFNRDTPLTSLPSPLPPDYFKHIGIYAYQRSALLTLAATPPCHLEQLEKLEQLRALYLGMRIHVTHTTTAPHGIDTPDDYKAFLARLQRSQNSEVRIQ